MRRDPAISFRGALQILGHDNRPWLDALDKALGGAILGSVVTPLAEAFGWVDQKNEAMGLLRLAVDGISARINGTSGLLRHELVAAAHTTIVMTAFFDALREYDQAERTDAEKLRMIAQNGLAGIDALYAAPVPAPSAFAGFAETRTGVAQWASATVLRIPSFGYDLYIHRHQIGQATARHYSAYYLDLAATVPEFAVWANTMEHSATRRALSALADLLPAHDLTPPQDLRAILDHANQSELHRPVINVDTAGYGIDAVFPSVETIFLDPRYRRATAESDHRLGDENWWADQPVANDLDVLLARHFSTPEATVRPLLMLGHPGAGKSLLTKVLAARLPASEYAVVRVPLRHVDANTRLSEQIQQALDYATHDRVKWPDLMNQSRGVIRVLLLDGLDELLQATNQDRRDYLNEIVDYQRVEAAMGFPLAVVVTSRTLVASRVDVPPGTPVVKLEEFNDDQIAEWVAVWNHVNANSGVRPMSTTLAWDLSDLSQQPLLLLMLTLYYADPDIAEPDTRMARVDLYGKLFDSFARREVNKKASKPLRGKELSDAADKQIRRLSIAAMGMFNRGKQHITEEELGEDLKALGEPVSGERLLGEFFFVHTDQANAKTVHRSYEFLHATFGEYLVAHLTIDVLLDAAESAYCLRREHEPDHTLVFALLSHYTLAIQRPALNFVRDRFARLPADSRNLVIRLLDDLRAACRSHAPGDKYRDYQPLPADNLRQVTAYTANLVLLTIAATEDSKVLVDSLWPGEPNVWRSTVVSWVAGLDGQDLLALLGALVRTPDHLAIYGQPVLPSIEVAVARLHANVEHERRLRIGAAVADGTHYFAPTGSLHRNEWLESVKSWLIAALAGRDEPMPAEVIADRNHDVLTYLSPVTDLGYEVLMRRCQHWSLDKTYDLAAFLLALPSQHDPVALAVATYHHVELFTRIPELNDHNLYRENEVAMLIHMASLGVEPEWTDSPHLRSLISELGSGHFVHRKREDFTM